MISHLTPSEDAALRRVVVIGELPADRERLTAALAHLGVTVHEGETLDALAERLCATETTAFDAINRSGADTTADPLFSVPVPGCSLAYGEHVRLG